MLFDSVKQLVDLFNAGSHSQNLIQLEQYYRSAFNNEAFLRLNRVRFQKARMLCDRLRRNARPKLFLGPSLVRHSPRMLADLQTQYGNEYSISRFPPLANVGDDLENLDLDGAIVILNSNDCMGDSAIVLLNLYARRPETIFAVWLWDNHHLLQNSCVMALGVDFFYPGHFDFLPVYHRLCPNVRGVLPCSVIQWSRLEAAEKVLPLLDSPRAVTVSGGYNFYPSFVQRNHVVREAARLIQDHSIRLREQQDYWSIPPDERLKTWFEAKCSLVVPVTNDLPIRFFDALLTGHVPIVADNIGWMNATLGAEALRELPVQWFNYSSEESLLKAVKMGTEAFDAGGEAGRRRRYDYAFQHHMIENRLEHILYDLKSF